MRKIDAIILLDDNSKKIIKTSISNFTSRNIHLITSLNELSQEILEVCNKVVVFEPFLQFSNAYSDLKLYKALLDLDYYFLYESNDWLCIMQDLAFCFCCDISTLSYETLQAAMFKDSILESDKQKAENSEMITMLASEVIGNQENYDYTTTTLAQQLLAICKKQELLQADIEQQKKIITQLSNENAFLHKNSSLLSKSFYSLIEEAEKQNRCMKQYEVAFAKDVYTKINLHEYYNRPIVIYLKEYEELLGLNLFIQTLFNVLRIQNRKSVKVLRLYDRSSCRKIAALPDYYKVITSKYYEKDIIANDFICKTGDYTHILETLLLNQIYLDILIVVDCKDLNDTVLSGSMLQLNLCRNPKHLKMLGLQASNTIVNCNDDENDVEQGILCWGHYDIANLSEDDKFLFLAARPIIQRVLQLLRLFGQAM